MGGFFSPTPQPQPQVVGGTPPAMGPFQEQLVRAISSLFPGQGGVSPLEESTLRGTFSQAQPVAESLLGTATGGFLPGVASSQGNPFLASLMQGIEGQGDIARRQLASAAQRAGALSSSDYINQSANLESGLAGQRGRTLADLYSQERGNMLQAPGALMGLSQGLFGMAQQPRLAATEAQYRPLQYGMNLLGGGAGQGQVIQQQYGPSPFSSLLSGIAPYAGLFL